MYTWQSLQLIEMLQRNAANEGIVVNKKHPSTLDIKYLFKIFVILESKRGRSRFSWV